MFGKLLTGRHLILLAGAFAVTGVAISLFAAPILSESIVLPDDVRSLAELQSLGVKVQPFSQVLEDAGLRAHEIQKLWEDRLQEAGFDVLTGPNRPHLWVAVLNGNIQGEGGQRAFGIQIKCFQHARVERLQKELLVPTYASGGFGMAGSDALRDQVMRGLDAQLEIFMRLVDVATDPRSVEYAP